MKKILEFFEIEKCVYCKRLIFGQGKVILKNGVSHYGCDPLIKKLSIFRGQYPIFYR